MYNDFSMNKKIKKRDGSFEPYYESKIAKVMVAAGLSTIEAQKIAAKVTEWVNSQQGEINSLAIRDKVLEELNKVSKYAAGFYTWYEKTKD